MTIDMFFKRRKISLINVQSNVSKENLIGEQCNKKIGEATNEKLCSPQGDISQVIDGQLHTTEAN